MCKSDKELSGLQMVMLGRRAKCDVGYIGKVENQERWDYGLYKEGYFSADEKKLIEKSGLEVLIDPENVPEFDADKFMREFSGSDETSDELEDDI